MGLANPRQSGAQVLFGSLVGSVTDSSGAAVPGATVTVTQAETQLTRAATTDSSGTYTLSTLVAGTYEVKISARGFKTFDKPGVKISINTVERVDATLEVGQITQTVEVTGAAPLLQADRPDVHHDLTSATIESIPLPPGNDFEELFRVVPGFNPPVDAHSIATNPTRSLQFNVNGASSYGNDVRIDGVTQFNIWVPENIAYVPSSDAIQVVNVTSASFNPEQGLAGGSSVNVQIKSGTNQLHGDVYEYHYDNALEGLPYFAPNQGVTRVPKDIFNQPGGSIGGPIKKDKLFYFGNVELIRQRKFATDLVTMPTLAMRMGDLRGLDLTAPNPDVVFDPASGSGAGPGLDRSEIFATNDPTDTTHFNAACTGAAVPTVCYNVIPTSRISPVAAALMSPNLFPAPNQTNESTNVPNSNYLGAADFAFNRFTTDEKIDWNATNKFTMYGRLGLLTFNDLQPQVYDVQGGKVGGEPISGGYGSNEGHAYGHTVAFSLTGNYVPRSNFVVDANFGMTRQVVNSTPLDVNEDWGTNGTLIPAIPGTNGSRKFEGSWPHFGIDGFNDLGTHNNFVPYFRNDPQFNFSVNVSWIEGTHNIRFGADFVDQHLNQQQPEWNSGGSSYGPQGGFQFSSGPTQCKGSATSLCIDAATGVSQAKPGKTSGSNAYNSFATFLLGLDTNFGRNIQVPDFFHTITHEYGLYVGDQWQATSKLTATVGLRWEYYPMPTRSGSRGVERFDFANNAMMECGVGGIPTDCGVDISKKNFAPRIGMAYRMRRNFVARAAYAITYDPFNLVDDLRTNYPVLLPLFVSNPTSLLAAGVLGSSSLANSPTEQCASFPTSCMSGALPVGIPLSLQTVPSAGSNGEVPALPNVSLATTPSKVQRGYIQSWNFTLEKEFGGWVADAGYVATRTIRQLGILNLNVQSPILPAGCVPGGSGATACGGNPSLPFNSAQYGNRLAGTGLITPITNNHYDSLQATLTHHFQKGYEVQFGYTWSKTIGMANVENEKGSPSIQTLSFYNLNRGLAPIDRPNNFEALFMAQPPFGTGKRWANTGVASRILGGWQVNGLVTAVSGSVVSLSASGTSLNASGNTQRPDLIKSHVSILGHVGPGTSWFDTSAFAGVNNSPLTANDQRFGTSAYYQFHGPFIFNTDLGLFRDFKLTERWNLQFRVQSFNFTNTPHFSNPNASCGSYQLATATAAAVPCSSSEPFGSFGSVTGTSDLARAGIDQRQFEFVMRLSF